jgi:hypothetical protein
MTGIVSVIIVTSIVLVVSGVLFPEPEPWITWYFIPGGCLSMIPEWTGVCHGTEECGGGHLAKSIKGHGPVDRSEWWKYQEGMVKIDYSRCGEEVSGPYFPKK